MILHHPNIKVSSGLKEGDAIIVYRAEHLVGYGELKEIAEGGVTIQLDKEASDRFSDLQGKNSIPYEFVVKQREYTNSVQA